MSANKDKHKLFSHNDEQPNEKCCSKKYHKEEVASVLKFPS